MTTATKVLYARVDPDLKDEIDSLASETGLSISTVTNIVLRKGLGTKWTPEYGVAKLIRLLQERDEPWELIKSLPLTDKPRAGSS